MSGTPTKLRFQPSPEELRQQASQFFDALKAAAEESDRLNTLSTRASSLAAEMQAAQKRFDAAQGDVARLRVHREIGTMMEAKLSLDQRITDALDSARKSVWKLFEIGLPIVKATADPTVIHQLRCLFSLLDPERQARLRRDHPYVSLN